MRTLHCINFLLLLVFPGFAGEFLVAPTNTVEPVSQTDIQMIVSVLRACPMFMEVGTSDIETRNAIVERLNAIRKFNLETIRAAEKAIVASPIEADIRAQFSIYVFHRLLFKIPRRVRGDAARTFGGFIVSSDSEGLNLLWPLKENDKGDLTLTGRAEGLGYMGPGYDPLAEFDFFRRTFALRKIGN